MGVPHDRGWSKEPSGSDEPGDVVPSSCSAETLENVRKRSKTLENVTVRKRSKMPKTKS